MKVKSRTSKKVYDTFVELDEEGNIVKWNCTCPFGSIWRFSEKLKDSICWHAIEVAEKGRKIQKLKRKK